MKRRTQRLGVDVATLGIAKLARRTCQICGHPMVEHAGQNGERVITGDTAAPGWYPTDAGIRWWDGARWTDQFQGLPAPAVDMTGGELERLADLHQQGALTAEEFSAAKRRLLGL